jgi:adenosylcobinamide-phosphate synthase
MAALESGDLPTARSRVAMIVGRDTAGLDESQVSRAVVETVAESSSDGIVAPLFYLTLGGVPLAMAYKAVNTLDSMIGHPEPPYTFFGRFAARADDLANLLPARLTALLLVAAAALHRARPGSAWRILWRDGHKHPSPNAGRPEAAMAGALGVRLGGLNTYGGRPAPKPYLGAEFEPPTPAAVRSATRLATTASLLGLALALAASAWGR